MDDRTEGDALTRVLLITLGGEPVRLRTLDLDESDAWLGKLAGEVDGFDIPTEDATSTADVFKSVFTQSSAVALRLVAEYDVADTLGGVEGIRARHPAKRELREAVEQMVRAEDPFGEDAVRTVAEVFGEPSRNLWRMVANLVSVAASIPALSTAGPSPDTGSGTPSSEAPGAGNSYSSDGPIPITKTSRTRKSA